MEAVTLDLATVSVALEETGLIVLGAFHPVPEDRVPPLAQGAPAGTLVVIGNAGPAMWRVFSASPEARDGAPDPLDRWSARVIGALAVRWRGVTLFPFGGPPYRPFVAWAKRAGPVAESPLGMLIHPDYGVWHAYRGAIALAGRLALPAPDRRPRPCDRCAERPCLAACPVGAFTGAAYDVGACVRHISASAGAECVERGCRARLACPVGPAYRSTPAQAGFHMRAFLRARREEAGET